MVNYMACTYHVNRLGLISSICTAPKRKRVLPGSKPDIYSNIHNVKNCKLLRMIVILDPGPRKLTKFAKRKIQID